MGGTGAFVICGAGALAGAARLRLVDSLQFDAAAALRICNLALQVLGVSLLLLLLLLPGSADQLLVQVTLCGGTLACTAMCDWGLGRLAGEAVSPRAMGAVIASSGGRTDSAPSLAHSLRPTP